jgi:hypothetical protein
MELLKSKKISKGSGLSTQKYVDVEEVKDGVIVLKNASLRAILLVSSINFDLKSTDEQDAIIGQYQNFLNSLDFPAQIIISSRKLDIKPYMEFLKNKESQITNDLLRLQISEYMNFIKNLTEVTNIMSKFFYIVVPFSPVETKEGGFFQKIMSMFNPRQAVLEKREAFETYENQLWQRVDHVIGGLNGIGVKVTPLKTEEVIELLYNSYNPTTFNKSVIHNTEQLELRR